MCHPNYPRGLGYILSLICGLISFLRAYSWVQLLTDYSGNELAAEHPAINEPRLINRALHWLHWKICMRV